MLRIALACSLVALASGPSLARDQLGRSASKYDGTYTTAPAAATVAGRDGVVVSAPTLTVWAATVSRKLGDTMRHPRTFSNKLQPEGVARVRFSCSENGVPTDMKLVRSSGHRSIDREALAAVRRLKTLHPLPTGVTHDQRYVAALIFATSKESLKRRMQAFRQHEASRADAGPAHDIVLTVLPGRVTG